jgi:hypothetical protein
VRTVRSWSSASRSPTVAALRLIVDQIPDPELALHVGTTFADRQLPASAWRRRFDRIRPVLKEGLERSGSSMEAFLTALSPALGGDGNLAAHIEEAAR